MMCVIPRIHSPRHEVSYHRNNRIMKEHDHDKGVLMNCDSCGRNGVAVARTSPYDQCMTAYAKKHVIKAWSLFNEFTYTDDNHGAMTRQLRIEADHPDVRQRGDGGSCSCPSSAFRLSRDLAILLDKRTGRLHRRPPGRVSNCGQK